MKKTDNQKEMLFLIGHKSLTGLINYVGILGILLIVIGLFCPFCSYNPSILDETKRMVKYTDLSYLIIASSLLLVAAIVIYFCVINTLSKSEWRSKTKRYLVLPVLTLVLVIVSIAIVSYACIFYRIPESKFDYLETEMEAGFYLFVIGGLLFSLAFLFFSLALRNLASGKTTIEKISINKNSQEKNNSENSTLTEKLEELQKLRDSNLITEEEYQLKKEEILKTFQ